MTKHILFTATILASLGAISPLNAQKTKAGNNGSKNEVKFLENISVEAPSVETRPDPKAIFTDLQTTSSKKTIVLPAVAPAIENASGLQIKFAQLLDMEVEEVRNISMFSVIDEWLGTRYKLGGSSKSGIDCSALMQIFFTSLYGIAIPRTAREQYGFSKRVGRTELREGDLVFFNTIGGVSHVGMYLENNKFVHASKNGVTISDLYEDYWLKHFIGAGRIENGEATALNLNP